MRFRAKVDRNQSEIVQALRDIGCSVQSLAALGKGVPDLLVGRRGRNWLMEVKDGKSSPSKRKLTEDEESWHAHWQGNVTTVSSIEEAIQVVQL